MSAPDGTTKFIDQIVTFADEDVNFIYFSWRAALLGGWDTFHVHWPEYLVRGRTPLRRLKNTALFTLLMLRIRLGRKPVVRTLHNVVPHAPGSRTEGLLLRLLDRSTTVQVALTEATPRHPHAENLIVKHGDYRFPFRDHPRSAVTPGLILYFGRIEPYKGVDILLDTFLNLTDDSRLRIVGKATPELRTLIESYADTHENISASFGFVPDDVLVAEISAASLVVLPYREMHNSGALLVALSLGVPVLAPRSAATVLMQEEVGEAWLNLYEGDLTPEALSLALRSAHTLDRSTSPDLPGRDWHEVAQGYGDAYRRSITIQHSA